MTDQPTAINHVQIGDHIHLAGAVTLQVTNIDNIDVSGDRQARRIWGRIISGHGTSNQIRSWTFYTNQPINITRPEHRQTDTP